MVGVVGALEEVVVGWAVVVEVVGALEAEAVGA